MLDNDDDKRATYKYCMKYSILPVIAYFFFIFENEVDDEQQGQ